MVRRKRPEPPVVQGFDLARPPVYEPDPDIEDYWERKAEWRAWYELFLTWERQRVAWFESQGQPEPWRGFNIPAEPWDPKLEPV